MLEYFLRPGLGQAYQRNSWVILSGYILIHIRSANVNLPVAWTLFHEMLFYALFGLLLVKKKVGVSGISCVVHFVHVCLCIRLPWFLGEYLISPLHLLFGLGLIVGYLLRQGVSAEPGSLRSSEAHISVVVFGALTFFLAVFLAGLSAGT